MDETRTRTRRPAPSSGADPRRSACRRHPCERGGAVPARTRRGFTLLELLVAITILATVSLIAWRGLDTLTATRARLEPEGEDVRALLIAFGQLERDLAGAVNPRFFASDSSPVEVRSIGGQPALSITRIAPVATDGATALQVVGYRVDEGVLVRSAGRPARGRGALAASEITNVRILEGVKSLRVRIWQEGVGWIAPPEPGARAPAQPAQPAAPAAPTAQPPGPTVTPGVEVTLERNDGKLYRRVFLVG